MSNPLSIGYIGLGLMGKSIARNILKAGFPLVVHNRSRGGGGRAGRRRGERSLLAGRGGRPGGCGLHQPARFAGCGAGGAWAQDGIIEGAHPG